MAVAQPPVCLSSLSRKLTANGSFVVARISCPIVSIEFLNGQVVFHPFQQRAEEIGLLDVLLALKIGVPAAHRRGSAGRAGTSRVAVVHAYTSRGPGRGQISSG